MSHQANLIYEFGSFRLEVEEKRLWCADEVIALPPRAFELLRVLVEHPGHLLEKEVLLNTIWPDAIVEEVNLANAISVLRKALGEDAHEPRYIETIPRRGYRFVGPVQKHEDDAPELNVFETAPATTSTATGKPDAVRFRRWSIRRVIAIAALVLLLGVAGAISLWPKKPASVAAPQKIRSVAVLPFRPITANSHDEALEMGLSEALIAKLSGLNQLIVRPISAVRKYNRPDQDPLAAGREQGVDAVLETYLQRNGDKVRVSALLRNVADGTMIEKFECIEDYCADIFVMQDTIAEKVAAKLASHLTAEDRRRLSKHYTENRAAHMSYNQGRRWAEKRTAEAWQQAIEFYNQALDQDPNYALAYVGLADAYQHSPLEPVNVVMPRSKAATMRALAIDETLGEAHAALAIILWQYEWKWSEAEREFKRALELDPNNAFAHRFYGYYLSSMGQHEESVAQLRQAQQIDPLSPILNLDIGQMLYFAGKIGPATEQFHQTQRLEPNYPEAYERLGMGYAQLGRYEEAVAALDKAMALEKDNVDAIAILGYAYARWGKREEALKRVDELRELSTRRNVSAFWPALIYAGLVDKDQAFHWLQRACQERFRYLVYLKVDIKFKSLHNDPRFADLLRCVGLPQ